MKILFLIFLSIFTKRIKYEFKQNKNGQFNLMINQRKLIAGMDESEDDDQSNSSLIMILSKLTEFAIDVREYLIYLFTY